MNEFKVLFRIMFTVYFVVWDRELRLFCFARKEWNEESYEFVKV